MAYQIRKLDVNLGIVLSEGRNMALRQKVFSPIYIGVVTKQLPRDSTLLEDPSVGSTTLAVWLRAYFPTHLPSHPLQHEEFVAYSYHFVNFDLNQISLINTLGFFHNCQNFTFYSRFDLESNENDEFSQ